MRISLILLFAVVLQLPASNGYAQRTRGSFSMSSVSIENVLNKIEENSDYVFLYNNKTIQADRIVSVNSRSGKITEILDDMFRGTNVTYTLVDNQIILSTKQIKQQEPKIKVDGVVKDATGEPLIGVNVKVKNTIAGTITDLDGKFNLAVNKGDVLEISYVGYTTKEIKIIDDRILNVLLEEDSQKLNEVVVTALGIKRAEKALSYNVQQVKQDELVRVKDANFVNSLSGKIAGVSINKSASGVGGATRVVMRGAKSIEGDNNALYVVDGIPLFNTNMGNTDSGIMGEGKAGTEGIADFNPEDIESLSVLSGPSAAALYGSSAANGVILITTKRGKTGKPDISYSGSVAFQYIKDAPDFLNARDFMIEQNKVFDELGRGDEKKYTDGQIANFVGDGTDWMDEVTRVGVVNEHNLSVSAGTDATKYLFSLSYYDHQGIAKNNSMNRITGRLNVDQTINRMLKAGINSTFSQIKYHDVPLGDARNDNSDILGYDIYSYRTGA